MFSPISVNLRVNRKLYKVIENIVLIGQTAAQLDETLAKVGYTAYVHAGYDFEKAINKAFVLAREGGNVLLSPACASFDRYPNFAVRGRHYKKLVNEL